MEFVITVLVSIGVLWVLNRPLDTFYRARLTEVSNGSDKAKELVDEFLKRKRPTNFGAALLLRKIGRLKDEECSF